MDREYRYRAFISYSHRDEKWASWLHKTLETYRVPKHLVGERTPAGKIPARLAPVFRDRDELPSATNLGDLLTESLRNSANLIVICSPAAAKSQWVNEEILGFKRLGRSDRIFCLIVDGEPWASNDPANADQECFPRSLRYELGEDNELSDRFAEPIAADAREQGDGKPNAKLKLISGMLGVGFDALKQREQQRRHRQMAFVATAASVGMLLTSGLATFALLARAEAERERVRAEQETAEARATRDFVVGLFEVSDPSEAKGNSITAREIVDKGAERIRTELNDQPETQATMMTTIGSVYTGLGLYTPAAQLLEDSLAIRKQKKVGTSAELAGTLDDLAAVLALTGDYDSAGELVEESLSLRDASHDLSAKDHAVLRADTQTGMADILMRKGKYEAAEPLIREALATRRELLGPLHADIAESLEDLGLNFYYRGNYDEAIENLQAAVAMQRELDPEPNPAISEAISNLALVHLEVGNYDAAESLYKEALAIDRKVLGDKHPELSTTMNNLAYVYQDKGELDAAEELYKQVLEIDRLNLPPIHPQIATSLGNLAWLQFDKGNIVEAIKLQTESTEMFAAFYPYSHPDLAGAHSSLGFMLNETGDYAAAEPHLETAYEMRKSLLGDSHPDVAKSLMTLATLHLDTERFTVAFEEAEHARKIFEATLGDDHWLTGAAYSVAGAAQAGLGLYSGAEQALAKAQSILAENPSAMQVFVDATAERLASLKAAMARAVEPTSGVAAAD
ncbi:MAG TPA: toll/interleukin-1 receptor domain-containing protein [Woeseiaceae bacterium]|nr:toll/interleukin-1 receptor domain-containing protein [Woeseiaceae bacterium]